jgi:flagellar biosynthesis regulator FlbT
MIKSAPNPGVLAFIMEASQKILEGEHYQALKICKKLLNLESELLANVTG